MAVRVVMKLVIEKREQLDGDLIRLWLRHSARPTLPSWSPGAHVDIRLSNGKVRQYSLTSDPNDLSLYAIIVQREESGRGGSDWIHESYFEGDEIRVSTPRNNFELSPGKAILIAGGIGVTPLISMGRALSEIQCLESFHFCSQHSRPAIERELLEFCGDSLNTYISEDPDAKRLDVSTIIEKASSDLHIYCCGPERLMLEVRKLTADWNPDQLHFELFNANADVQAKPEPFDIIIASSGETLRVSENRSILDVLRMAGYVVPSSCRQGICGTCECRYTAGEVIHQDSVLDLDAKQDRMMICVSRAKVSVTLDL
ncbi:PDR/VanB family oxidoreductase [Burkholderiales bacterium]|nr:PDR/VanB family oxidoreductase [Burkholderiales bacterium]